MRHQKRCSSDLICKTEMDSQTLKNLWLPKPTDGERGMDHRFRIGICTLRYMEWLANGDLLLGTETSTQYSVISTWWKNLNENGYTYMYNWILLLYSRSYHNLVNQLYFNKTLENGKKSWNNITWFGKHLSIKATERLKTIYQKQRSHKMIKSQFTRKRK